MPPFPRTTCSRTTAWGWCRPPTGTTPLRPFRKRPLTPSWRMVPAQTRPLCRRWSRAPAPRSVQLLTVWFARCPPVQATPTTMCRQAPPTLTPVRYHLVRLPRTTATWFQLPLPLWLYWDRTVSHPSFSRIIGGMYIKRHSVYGQTYKIWNDSKRKLLY